MKITFLIHSLYVLGGTIRTTLNSAEALADRGHDVEIVSVFRHRTAPMFRIDPRITVRTLVDGRTTAEPLPTHEAALARRPSTVFPKHESRYGQYSRLTDARIERALADCDADVIVGTRPGLNVHLARSAPEGAVTVGQEHMFLSHHNRRLTTRLAKAYRSLDAVTTVTETDAQDYRRAMPRIADRVHHLPNSVPPTPLPPADGTSRLIVAAGRLDRVKRYDLLLDAFATVARHHPDWQLRIYGHGDQAEDLRARSEQLGLHNRVRLMGTHTPIDAELVKGSILVSSSDLESFGMTIIEAMTCGVPVVSTACRFGPPEIITDGVDGLLTPPGDAPALAAAIESLITDPARRAELAANGRRTAQDYTPDRIARRYEQLFNDLLRAKGKTPPAVTPRPVRARTVGSCVSDGFTALRLRLPATTAPVVLRNDGDTVTITTQNVDGDTVATIDAPLLAGMPAGVWTVHLGDAPVLADRIDTRALVGVDDPPDSAAVPFAQNHELAIRLWRRPGYAEVDTVDWDDRTIVVTGRLRGDTTGAREAVVRRRKADTEPVRATLAVTGDRFVLRWDTTTAREASGTRLWDLWLVTDSGEIRVARFFDDQPRRKKTHKLPGRRFGPDSARRIQPYFTVDNELSVKVADVD